MGAGPSSLGGTLSREKLLEGTKVTRQIVDIIFEYLMENINLRDFYSLSSADRCRRYVLFTANTLYSKFIQFQIEPQKGKDGTIWFRSVSDLTDPPKAPIGSDPSKDERFQQQKLCLQLAYFYVRIFQIYGALALTLVDDSKFMVEHGYTKSFFTGTTIDQPGKLPRYAPAPSKIYTIGPSRMTGGGLYDKASYEPIPIRDVESQLELFQVLYTILYVSKFRLGDDDVKGAKAYWIKVDKKSAEKSEGPGAKLVIQPGKRIEEKKTQKGKIILETGIKNEAVLYVDAELFPRSRTIVLTFDTTVVIKREDKEFREYGILDSIPHRFSFFYDDNVYFQGIKLPKWEAKVEGSLYSVESVMRKFLEQVWDKIKIIIKPGLLEKSDGFVKKEVVSDLTSAKWTEDRDAVEHLKIQPIIDGMTRKRRFGHCIGRALQLLTTIPSLSGTYDMSSKTSSSICDLKFSRDYIDTPTGASLSDSASITAMANLFYDVIDGYPKPDLSIGGQTVKEYVLFIKQLSELFADKSFAEADITTKTPEDALKAIKSKESTVCDKDNKKILMDTGFAMSYVYPHVQELFRTQLVHASNCAKIFTQLFDIRREAGQYRVRIHPNVLARGIDEVNRIAKITRNVLIAYYSNCESIYVKGVMNIENAIRNGDQRVKAMSDKGERVGDDDEDEKDKAKKSYEKAGKEGELIKSRYGPEAIEEYMRAKERRERDRDRYPYRDNNRYNRGLWGGGHTTRKRKRK